MDPDTKKIVRDALESKISSVTTLSLLFFFFSAINACSAAQELNKGQYGTAAISGVFSLLLWLLANRDWRARKETQQKLADLDTPKEETPPDGMANG